jgi:glyoxylase-like metal-dependent hydrolase (beta-lactamase superfamily II)
MWPPRRRLNKEVMMIRTHRRFALVSLFVLGLGWSYQHSAAQRSVPPVVPVLTEEGQQVVFRQPSWQARELAKRLPLDEPWPPRGPEMEKALARFGLDRGSPPFQIPSPARILTDFYLVGQDHSNGNLTFLVDCGPEGVAIIDPSFESQLDKTLANAEQCGFSRKQIRWVINTHCHFDHAAADLKFRQMGAKVLIHEADADAVEKVTRITAYSQEREAKRPVDLRNAFPPCKVDHRLSDGEELQLGNKLFHVIHTPGHTPGSVCFLVKLEGKNLLISGDTVFYDGMLGWQANPYADNRRYLASLEKLEHFTLDAPVHWDVLLPGHGAISMDRAYLDVQKCRENMAGDVVASREPAIGPHARPDYRRRMYGRPATRAVPQR